MHWLGMILSFAFGRFNLKTKSLRETAQHILDDAVIRGRQLLTQGLIGLASVIFFCGGIFIALLDFTGQYDKNGFVEWSATLGGGIALMVIAISTFAVTFYVVARTPQMTLQRKPEQELPKSGSPIENALAALVMDFIKEREARRVQKQSERTQEPQFNEENPTYRDRDEEETTKATPPLH